MFWLPVVFFLILSLYAACLAPAGVKQTLGTSESPAPASPVADGETSLKPAWEMEWEKIQSSARKEGRIIIYGAPAVSSVRNSFIQELKKFGLAAEVFVGTGGVR